MKFESGKRAREKKATKIEELVRAWPRSLQEDVVIGHVNVGDNREDILDRYRECPYMEVTVIEEVLASIGKESR